MEHRDRRLILKALGIALLLAGVACAFLGPVELHVFYLFSEGGRFHFDGFRFGSFMFANIAVQVLAYYLAAAVLIPLGYGHAFLRRWVRPLAIALLWTWILLGVPLLIVLFFMTVSVKEFSTVRGIGFILLLLLSYFAVPWIGIRFYRGRNIHGTLEAHDPRPSALEALPLPILVICLLDLFFLIALHVLLLNGLFPVFGALAGGLDGCYLTSAAVLILGLLLWGTWKQYAWAWWGSAICYAALAASWIATFARISYASLLPWLQFAPAEIKALSGIPLRGYEIGLFVGLPMLACLVVILTSRRYFGARARIDRTA
jgi:hypothetical protein